MRMMLLQVIEGQDEDGRNVTGTPGPVAYADTFEAYDRPTVGELIDAGFSARDAQRAVDTRRGAK